jgi:hypothetical protein
MALTTLWVKAVPGALEGPDGPEALAPNVVSLDHRYKDPSWIRGEEVRVAQERLTHFAEVLRQEGRLP